MKKIEAIIRTSKFEDVKKSLSELGIDFFSYWEASGIGNEKQRKLHGYRRWHDFQL
jgi:nitrogen regulatory protein P-II 1